LYDETRSHCHFTPKLLETLYGKTLKLEKKAPELRGGFPVTLVNVCYLIISYPFSQFAGAKTAMAGRWGFGCDLTSLSPDFHLPVLH
jgi:hypothetical protein